MDRIAFVRKVWMRANLNLFADYPRGIRQLRVFIHFCVEVAPITPEFFHSLDVLRELLWAPYWDFTPAHATSYACIWDGLHVLCRLQEEGGTNPHGHIVTLTTRGGAPLRCP